MPSELWNKFHKKSEFLLVSEEDIFSGAVTKVIMVNVPNLLMQGIRNMVQWCQRGYHGTSTTNFYQTEKTSLSVL